jgi:serine/threonine protein kinase
MDIKKIGRYKIVAELGQGAMGVVYKGFDDVIQRYVAIKMIYLDKVVNKEEFENSRKRFYRESQAAGKLSHPNIITIYDINEHEGQPFIAMEYVDGESLSEKIKKAKGGLPWQFVINIFIQVAQGLDYAHNRGVIHRDIKPANILISSSNQAKIADFGIAKISLSNITQTGMILGTPSYMAPEQITHSVADNRSDIFSLGATIYETITGANAFTGDDISQIIGKIIHYNPPILESFPPDIPSGLEQIIEKTLKKEPAQRYQSCAEIVVDLEQIKHKAAKAQNRLSVSHTVEITAKTKLASFERKKYKEADYEPEKELTKKTKEKISSWPLFAGIGLLLIIASVSIFFIIQKSQSKIKKPPSQTAIPSGIEEEIIDSNQRTGEKDNKPKNKAKKPSQKAIDVVPDNGSARPDAISLNKEISITSIPPGATILVDGEDSGLLTPSIIQLEALQDSEHIISLASDCFEKVSKQLRIRDDEKVSLTFKLTPTIYIINIDSRPPQAKIIIDGEDIGKFTPAEIQVNCGQSYKLTLAKEGFNPFDTTLKAGMNDEHFTYDLKRELIAMQLNINSKPQGASIFKNNKDAGIITPATLKLEGYKGEKINITLKKEGYKSISRDLTLTDALKGPLQLTLSPEKRTLTVKSNPSGAEVIVNGQKMKSVTPLKLDIFGNKSYAMKLLKDGYYPKEITIDGVTQRDSISINLEKLPPPGQIVVISPYKVDMHIEGDLVKSFDKEATV